MIWPNAEPAARTSPSASRPPSSFRVFIIRQLLRKSDRSRRGPRDGIESTTPYGLRRSCVKRRRAGRMGARLPGFAWSAGSLPDAEFSPQSDHGSSRTMVASHPKGGVQRPADLEHAAWTEPADPLLEVGSRHGLDMVQIYHRSCFSPSTTPTRTSVGVPRIVEVIGATVPVWSQAASTSHVSTRTGRRVRTGVTAARPATCTATDRKPAVPRRRVSGKSGGG